MDRRAKVHGELAADAVRRGVRQDNGPDAVILLKSDRRHFSHSSVRSGFRRRQDTPGAAAKLWRAGELHVSLEHCLIGRLRATGLRSYCLQTSPFFADCRTQGFDQSTVDTVTDEQSDDAAFRVCGALPMMLRQARV
jgi:hypothetical protein